LLISTRVAQKSRRKEPLQRTLRRCKSLTSASGCQGECVCSLNLQEGKNREERRLCTWGLTLPFYFRLQLSSALVRAIVALLPQQLRAKLPPPETMVDISKIRAVEYPVLESSQFEVVFRTSALSYPQAQGGFPM
jgi:hypothetical protein